MYKYIPNSASSQHPPCHSPHGAITTCCLVSSLLRGLFALCSKLSVYLKHKKQNNPTKMLSRTFSRENFQYQPKYLWPRSSLRSYSFWTLFPLCTLFHYFSKHSGHSCLKAFGLTVSSAWNTTSLVKFMVSSFISFRSFFKFPILTKSFPVPCMSYPSFPFQHWSLPSIQYI